MSATSDIQARREQIAVDYFRKVDAGDPSVTDLFTPDAVMFYPKFGYARGPAQIAAFARGLARGIAELEHEIDGFTVLSSGDHVVVEGVERGTTTSGVTFPDGESTYGLFCNVFEFEGELVRRVHIYVDPDFAATHEDGVAWGRSVREDIATL